MVCCKSRAARQEEWHGRKADQAILELAFWSHVIHSHLRILIMFGLAFFRQKPNAAYAAAFLEKLTLALGFETWPREKKKL